MMVKVVGMAATFAVSIILGRTIGPEGLGIINLSNRIVAIVLIFATVGMNNVVLKEVAIGFEKQDWQHVANTIFSAFRINIPLALLFSGLMVLVSPWLIENVFHEPDLKIPLIISLTVVVFQITSRIFASGVNGFRKIWQSSLVNDTLSAMIVAIGLNAMIIFGIKITVINVAILYATARILVTISIGSYWKKLFKFNGKKRSNAAGMLKVGIPLLIFSSSNLIATNADTIMLGWLSNVKEVGLYSVGIRLGLLTNFLLLVTNSNLAPKIASLFATGKILELERMIQKVTGGLIVLSVVSILIFILFGKYILSIWGTEFTKSYAILVIISLGQFINIGTGATGVILMMTGFEKLLGKITLLSAVINVGLNFWLIPIYGGIGAAITSAVTFGTENIIKVIIVKQKTGILTIPLFKL